MNFRRFRARAEIGNSKPIHRRSVTTARNEVAGCEVAFKETSGRSNAISPKINGVSTYDAELTGASQPTVGTHNSDFSNENRDIVDFSENCGDSTN